MICKISQNFKNISLKGELVMKSLQSKLLILVALLSIGLIITSGAKGVGPERENAIPYQWRIFPDP